MCLDLKVQWVLLTQICIWRREKKKYQCSPGLSEVLQRVSWVVDVLNEILNIRCCFNFCVDVALHFLELGDGNVPGGSLGESMSVTREREMCGWS